MVACDVASVFSRPLRESSPDLKFSQSWFNPTKSKWSDVVEDLKRCPAVAAAVAADTAAAAAAAVAAS
jgi:hypothetical protein